MARKKKSQKTLPPPSSLKKKAIDLYGLTAVFIVILICGLYSRNLFPADSSNSLARFLIYGIFILIAAVCSYRYCAGADAFFSYRKTAIAFFAVTAVYYTLSISGAWYFGGDSGQYLVLTKSLATFRGFVNLHQITPTPHTFYGMGLPLFLVPAYWLFGASMWPLNFSIALSSAGFIVALYFLFRDELDRNLLIVVLLAVAVNYWIVWHSGVIMTEMPFFLLFTLTLLAVNWYESESKVLSFKLAALVLAAFLSYQTKAIGLVFLPVVPVYYFLKKERMKALAFALLLLVLVGAWNLRGEGGISSYIKIFASAATLEKGSSYTWYQGEGFLGNVILKPLRLAVNGGKFLVPMAFSRYNQAPVTTLYFPVLYVLGLIGMAWHLWKRRSMFNFTLIVIFPAIATYGGLMYPERWWMPFIPFVLLYIVIGVRILAESVAAKTRWNVITPLSKLAQVALMSWVVGVGLNSSDVFIQKKHPSRAYTPQGSAFVEAALWVKKNTPPDALVASRLDKEFYLLSDRKGGNSRVWGYERFTNTLEMQQQVLDAFTEKLVTYDYDYWILDNTRLDSQIAITVLAQHPDATNRMFQLVFAYPPQPDKPLVYVMKVNKEWVAQERTKRGEK